MPTIAYYTHYDTWLGNQMFDLKSAANTNDVLDRWVALRDHLAQRNISLNTYDQYDDPRSVDLWLMQEPLPDRFKYLLRHRISLRRAVFLLHEPPVVNPFGWRWLWLYRRFIGGVLTWQSEFCRTLPRTYHYHLPVRVDADRYAVYRDQPKRNLFAMMHSNKVSSQPGELYSLRRNIIRHFEERGDALLDLWGRGWNDDSRAHPFHTPLYQGTAPDKRLTLSQYHFVLCVDNCVEPGYITYDPFLSMAVGSVPVYLPMPDATQFIPEDTFVNYNEFASPDDLAEHLKALAADDEAYQALRDRGWQFVNSPAYRPFTIEQFCEDMSHAITALGRFD